MSRLLPCNAAASKIRKQFPTSPEGRLQFAVIAQAIKDLCEGGDLARKARWFINRDMDNAEICGVSSEWIREVIRKCGVQL